AAHARLDRPPGRDFLPFAHGAHHHGARLAGVHPILRAHRIFAQCRWIAALAGETHDPAGLLPAGDSGRFRDHQARGLPDGPHPRSDAAARPWLRRHGRGGHDHETRGRAMTALFIANIAPLMFAMLIVLLMIGYPVAFSLAANGLLFGAIAIHFGLLGPDLIQALPQRIFGIMSNDTLLAIPFFTFMGLILERSGMAEDLLDTIGQMFGPIRGGLAYAVVFVGALLAATTGV